jgi:hypothetical protein
VDVAAEGAVDAASPPPRRPPTAAAAAGPVRERRREACVASSAVAPRPARAPGSAGADPETMDVPARGHRRVGPAQGGADRDVVLRVRVERQRPPNSADSSWLTSGIRDEPPTSTIAASSAGSVSGGPQHAAQRGDGLADGGRTMSSNSPRVSRTVVDVRAG